jgi:flavoprotein
MPTPSQPPSATPYATNYKEPDASDVLPPADAMVVAPITCNSLAKWAAGISDTLPLGLFGEAVGKRQPVVAMPFSNRAQINSRRSKTP